jgi:hypothetical protein
MSAPKATRQPKAHKTATRRAPLFVADREAQALWDEASCLADRIGSLMDAIPRSTVGGATEEGRNIRITLQEAVTDLEAAANLLRYVRRREVNRLAKMKNPDRFDQGQEVQP